MTKDKVKESNNDNELDILDIDESENFEDTSIKEEETSDKEISSEETSKKSKRKRKQVDISSYFYKSYYKDDSLFTKLDDSVIINKILKKYPDFKYEVDTKELKKMFLNILDDYVFIWSILDSQKITIKEFLTTIVRNYDKMFNSIVYYRKIQEKVIKHNYNEDSDE